jgi:hypothetical protein
VALASLVSSRRWRGPINGLRLDSRRRARTDQIPDLSSVAASARRPPIRETQFCGQRLAGISRATARQYRPNSRRRPHYRTLTDRNVERFYGPGNSRRSWGLHGGAEGNRTHDLFMCARFADSCLRSPLPWKTAHRPLSHCAGKNARGLRSGIFKQQQSPRAMCSSPNRGARDVFELWPDGVGR